MRRTAALVLLFGLSACRPAHGGGVDLGAGAEVAVSGWVTGVAVGPPKVIT